MSFWNVNLDDWIRRRLYFDESISVYMFRTAAGWYDGNSSWYNNNNYSELRDINEWYDVEYLQEELLEDLRDMVLRHNRQESPQGLVIEEENHTMSSEKQVNSEAFIPYYRDISATPKVSSKGKRIETKKFKKSSNHLLSSFNSDGPRTYVYPDQYDVEKEAIKGKEDDYPLETIRSDGLIRITTQTPFVEDKNKIKVKIYDDNSIEISIDDDGDSLQNNKKYYRIVEVPKDVDIETAKCTYRNGILEITFKQKNR